ncbi:MAG: enolase C-terminal domain-like protein [Halobacteriaceae archaeon]
MDATIERIDRHYVQLPYREVPGRNMYRGLPHWGYYEVFEVELADGSVGFGEEMLYTWGQTTDYAVAAARGANAAELLWEDAIGKGLQMALFDAVGRSLGVPVHELLGEKVHDETPVSWWCRDMPPEDWVSEAKEALDRGYTNIKVKGRPWFDIRAQMEALDAELPEWFSVDIDFNSTLLSAERALPLLEELQQYPQVSHFEGPIENDRAAALADDVCDGFVTGGTARELLDIAAVTEMAGKPFWIQLIGSALTAAFSLHCGGVCEQATWPGINCHQLYEEQLLAEPIAVEDGRAEVPDDPGLGYEVDRDAIEEFAVDPPAEPPNPERLIETDWPDGPTVYFADGEATDPLYEYAMAGEMPYFARGVRTRLVPDDGSETWRDLHDRASDSPVEREEPAF